jgi:hypothetical protein
LYLAYLMALMVVILGEYKLSRGQVFGTCLALAGMEWGVFTLLYGVLLQGAEGRDRGRRSEVGGQMSEVGGRISDIGYRTSDIGHRESQREGTEVRGRISDIGHRTSGMSEVGGKGQRSEVRGQRSEVGGRISPLLLLTDMGLVGLAFFLVNFLKRGHFGLMPEYETLLLLIYGAWFVCSAVTDKFRRKPYANFYQALWPWIKSGALMFLSLGLIVFLFRFTYFSRTQVFGSVLVLFLLEAMLCALYVARKQQKGLREDIESLEHRQKILRQEKLPVRLDVEEIRARLLTPVREGLREKVLKDNRPVFDFLDKSLDLNGILQAEMVLRNSPDMPAALDMLENRLTRLSINLHKVNDIRWLNRYFLEIHNRLVPGGCLVAMAHTIQTHREWMFQKYPRSLARILYALDFAVHRVGPKLPWIKQVYFSATKGRDRRISRAEVLGRLCFCGFEIVAEKEINKRLYVVARKQLTPSLNANPTYGPFVTLRRVGQSGEVLSIYKFRTMHPYSEFLQDYVYEKHGLQKGGKLEDDFRVTEWGRVMRKLWLDELPMLYNWMKGDLQLIGVRPLSAQYLSMYPKDLQELRMKVKPGLVPPFYADMPESFEEICASERRYIEAYLERSVGTQAGYFLRAMWNIVVKGARSK